MRDRTEARSIPRPRRPQLGQNAGSTIAPCTSKLFVHVVFFASVQTSTHDVYTKLPHCRPVSGEEKTNKSICTKKIDDAKLMFASNLNRTDRL